MTSSVITISREYGSGGRFVAQKLSEKLGIPFYDNEIITRAAKESGYAESMFEKAEQISTHSLLYSLSMFGSSAGVYGLPLSDKVFLVQSDIIQKVASEGPCILVGRCSDYVLKDRDNVISFFLYSDMPHKIERVKTYYHPDTDDVEALITKRDKKRAAYYNYYTTRRWGDIDNYHLSVNTDAIGIDATVSLLENFVNAFEAQAK